MRRAPRGIIDEPKHAPDTGSSGSSVSQSGRLQRSLCGSVQREPRLRLTIASAPCHARIDLTLVVLRVEDRMRPGAMAQTPLDRDVGRVGLAAWPLHDRVHSGAYDAIKAGRTSRSQVAVRYRSASGHRGLRLSRRRCGDDPDADIRLRSSWGSVYGFRPGREAANALDALCGRDSPGQDSTGWLTVTSGSSNRSVPIKELTGAVWSPAFAIGDKQDIYQIG